MLTNRPRIDIADQPIVAVTVAGLVAALAAYEVAQGGQQRAVALCLLPVVAVLLARPTIPLVALGASIPLLHSFTVGGYFVTISDLLLVLVTTGIVLREIAGGSTHVFGSLRPLAFPLAVYASVMFVLLPAHFSLSEIVKTGQRFELFVFPLVVGAFAA